VQIKKLVKQRVTVMLLTFQILNHRCFVKYSTSNRRRFMGQNSGWFNLADIENVLFFIVFVRFVILALRYNLKTSFYITCIGLLLDTYGTNI
jgi:uncharacterized membrane protein YhdT